MKRRLLLGAALGGFGACLACGGLSCSDDEVIPAAGPTLPPAAPSTSAPVAPTATSDAGGHDATLADAPSADAADDVLPQPPDATPECGAPTNAPAPCEPPPGGLLLGPPSDFQAHGLHPVGDGNLIKRVLVGHDCGGLYALRALCPHMGCTLALDSLISEDGVTCGCHGSRFDLQGRVIKGPAKKDLAPEAIVLGCDGLLYIDETKTAARSDRLVVES